MDAGALSGQHPAGGKHHKGHMQSDKSNAKLASKLLQISDAEHALKAIRSKRNEDQIRKEQAAVGSRRWTLEWPASYVSRWDSKRPTRRDGNCRKKMHAKSITKLEIRRGKAKDMQDILACSDS